MLQRLVDFSLSNRWLVLAGLLGLVLAGGYVLLWENEWRTLRDARGAALDVVAVSDSSRPRSGHLALVRVPAGPVRAVGEPPPAAREPGLRNRD